MKRILLAFAILFCCTSLFAQGRFGGGLAQNSKSSSIEIQVFPNPASNHIGVSDNDQITKVVVFNLVGRKMKSFEAVKGKKYYVGDLPKGLYLVQILGKQNKILTTQRVSKR